MLSALFFVVVLTVVLVFSLRPVALTIGLVDAPCVRKRHDGAVPLVGGVSIYLAITLSCLFVSSWGQASGFGMLILGLPILLVGAIDDRRGLSPRLRFVVEIVCCLIAAQFLCIRLDTVGELWPGIWFNLGIFSIALTVIGFVGVINSFNMTDGVDGLAGGLAFLIFSALAVLAGRGDAAVALQLWTLAAAALGFLFFNSRFFGRSRAAIFMGDAGTLFIGFAIAWYLIKLSQGENAVITPVAALWLFAAPLFDTISVMLRRIRRGQSPFHADREHLHHIFLLAGFGVNRTVLIILGFQAIYIGYAFASLHFAIPQWISFWLFIAVFVTYYWMMGHAWQVMKRVKQFREWAGFECRRNENAHFESGRRMNLDRRSENLAFSGVDRRMVIDRRQKDRRGVS